LLAIFVSSTAQVIPDRLISAIPGRERRFHKKSQAAKNDSIKLEST